MREILQKIKKWVLSAPKGFWIALIAAFTWIFINAKRTASEVVEIERKRLKRAKLQKKRAEKIQESLDKKKEEIDQKKEELEEETTEAQKEITAAAQSMEETANLANSVFKEQ